MNSSFQPWGDREDGKTFATHKFEPELWPGKQTATASYSARVRDGLLGDIGKLRSVLQGMDGGGSPLPDGVSSRFSQLLGADLSGVRVHASGSASGAAVGMGARAFTHGSHIAFAPGTYDPGSSATNHVLAHELVHVVQNQRAGGQAMQLAARLDVGPSDSAVESEAEAGAHALTSGCGFTVSNRDGLPGISLFSSSGRVPSSTPEPGATAAPTTTGTATSAPTTKPATTGTGTPTATPVPAPTSAPTPKPAATGTPVTTASPGAKGIPSPQPTARATPTATPAPKSLDARIAQILEQRADPKAKVDYSRAVGQVQALRLQAVQYSFQPSGFGNTLFQTLVFPTDAVSDHAAQIYSNNAYRGGNSFVDGLQATIEGLRGGLHILGDIAQIISAWAGMVAIVSGLIALIGSETGVLAVIGGAIAAIADAVSVMAALIKIMLDIIDMILGLLQMITLIIRARATKDPGERARFAQLLHKEASDMAANIVGVATQAAVLVVTAGVGAGMSKGLSKVFTKEFTSTFGEELGKLINPRVVFKGGIAGIAEKFSLKQVGKGVSAAGGGKVVGVAGEAVLKLSVLKRVAGRVTKDREIIPFTVKNQMRGARLVRCNEALRKIGTLDSVVIGGGMVSGVLLVKSKAPDPSSIAQPGGRGDLKVPDKPQGALTTVEMWPSQLEAFSNAKSPLKDAISHVEEQYDKAKEQAGPALVAQVEKKLKDVSDHSKKQKAAATAVQADAAEGKQNSDKGADTAGKAKTAQDKGNSTKSQLDAQTNKANAAGAQMTPPAPKDGPLGWLYNQTIGRIGGWIGSAQAWLRNWIGKAVMWAAGFDKNDLDLAGIENDMRTDATKDMQSRQQAQETAAKDDPVQQAVYELMKDKSTDQQNAIQGMAESQGVSEALEEADKTLDEAIKNGQVYIDTVAPILQHELDVQTGGKPIDGAYVAPITGYADAFVSSITGDRTGATAQSQADAQLDAMHAAFEGLDVSPGKAQVAQIVSSYKAARASEVSQARAGAEKIKTQIGAFVGTTDYAGVNANAQALDQLAADFDAQDERLGDELYRELNAVLEFYNDAIDKATADASTVSDDVTPAPGADNPNANGTANPPNQSTPPPNQSTLPPNQSTPSPTATPTP